MDFNDRGNKRTQDDLVVGALLEALASRLICIGKSDVRPRVFQAGRIEGSGTGYGKR